MSEEKINETQRHERYLQTILENIKEHIIHVDVEGKILYVNHLTHKNINIVIGSYLQDYILSSHRELFEKTLKSVISSREVRNIEIAHKYEKNGELSWYDKIMTPLYDNGNIYGVIIIARDITSTKSLEDKLRSKTQKLSEASDAIGKAFLTVSHMLNDRE